MLQQTRVETVVPYYERFLAALPDIASLAEAPEERVLALWSGLGYYRRARMLHAAAKSVAREHGGRLPEEPEALRRLEGIGAYTAGAVASIAFGKRAALVDGNVARVLARLFCHRRGREDVGRVRTLVGHRRRPRRARRREGRDPGGLEPGAHGARRDRVHAGRSAVRRVPGRRPIASASPAGSPGLCRARRPGARRPWSERVAIVVASDVARRPGAAPKGGALRRAVGAAGRGRRRSRCARLDGWASTPGRSATGGGSSTSSRTGGSSSRSAVAPLGRRRRWPSPGEDYDAIEAVPIDELRPGPASGRTRRSPGRCSPPPGVLTLAKAARRGLRSTSK